MTDQPDTLAVWEREEGVTCVVCPECAFTFDASHVDDTPERRYSCPACGEREQLEAIRQAHVWLENAIGSKDEDDGVLVQRDGLFWVYLICARDRLNEALPAGSRGSASSLNGADALLEWTQEQRRDHDRQLREARVKINRALAEIRAFADRMLGA